MHFKQYDLDLMKREVDEFGVEGLLGADSLRWLIADLEAARRERDEAREQARLMGEAMDRGSGF